MSRGRVASLSLNSDVGCNQGNWTICNLVPLCPTTWPYLPQLIPVTNHWEIGHPVTKSTKMSSSKVRKFKHVFATPTPSSSLPPDIQSSLLQVGMRVRKSVNQGYKGQAQCLSNLIEWKPHSAVMARGILRRRPSDEEKTMDILDENTEEMSGEIFSSQSTNSTAAETTPFTASSNQAGMKKRSLEANEDHYCCAFPDEDDNMDATSTHLRPMAQPKSRKRSMPANSTHTKPSDAQDTALCDDFEEADFLVVANAGSFPINREH